MLCLSILHSPLQFLDRFLSSKMSTIRHGTFKNASERLFFLNRVQHFSFSGHMQNKCIIATNKTSELKKKILFAQGLRGNSLFHCSCKAPMENSPPPPKRSLKQVNSICSWLPATPHNSPECRRCWGHAISGNGCDWGFL